MLEKPEAIQPQYRVRMPFFLFRLFPSLLSPPASLLRPPPLCSLTPLGALQHLHRILSVSLYPQFPFNSQSRVGIPLLSFRRSGGKCRRDLLLRVGGPPLQLKGGKLPPFSHESCGGVVRWFGFWGVPHGGFCLVGPWLTMEYNPSDSSGTDDDLPPTLQNRGARGGRAPGNGRTPVMGSLPHARMHGDMEAQIHQLEQEAYCSVLLAFKAQSDAITWEKESLITELRKELKVSDEEHRKLLSQVNADDIIRRIREWRQAGGPQSGLLSNTNTQSVHNGGLSPTASASRKKHKTSQTRPSVSPALHSQAVAANVQPLSSSAAKRGAVPIAARGKKQNSGQMLPSGSSIKSTQYPSAVPAGRGQVANRPPPGAHLPVEPAEAAKFDPLIGRKVLTRWPEDNNFYEAVITDYNPAEGLHALVYDINTKDETWEWVNLKEISPEDIRWEGEEPGIAHRSGRGVPGRGAKKSMGRGGAIPGTGRGRGSLKHPSKKDFPPSQNGIGKKGCDIIEILHTDTLIKEVEKAFGSGHPDPFDVEKAKKVLKDHEQSLIDAITRLADASDGESEEGEHQVSVDRG